MMFWILLPFKWICGQLRRFQFPIASRKSAPIEVIIQFADGGVGHYQCISYELGSQRKRFHARLVNGDTVDVEDDKRFREVKITYPKRLRKLMRGR